MGGFYHLPFFIAPLVFLPGNSMDKGAWQATVHGFTKSLTQRLNTHTVIFGFKYKVEAEERSTPGPILINTVI